MEQQAVNNSFLIKSPSDDENHYSISEAKSDLQKFKYSFLMFGIGMLLPWNVMLAAMGYFTEKFPDYQPQFSLLVAVSVPMLAVQILVFFFLQYIPQQIKLTGTFMVNTIITVLLVLMPLIIKNQATAYYITLLLAILFGCSYAVLQASLYAAAGPEAILTNNLMLGLGLSSLIVNAFQMIFLAAIKNLNLEAQLFFYGAAAFLVVCTYLSFLFVKKSDTSQKVVCVQERWEGTKQVYAVNWKQAWSVCLVYWVFFTFYPGVMLSYQFTFIKNFSWFVIVVVTFSSWADTIGRFVAGKIDIIPKNHLIYWSLIYSVIFTTVYLLAFFNVKFFEAQTFIIISLGLYSAGVGYLSTLAMRMGSDQQTKNQGLAGTVMGIHLTLGICLGSTFAILFLS